MPDGFGFDHLVWHGRVTHRCTACGWPEGEHNVTAGQRMKHHATHVREREREAAKQRKANLRQARVSKARKRQENATAYE